MKVEAIGITDIGKKRENNEDFFLINDDLNLYIVADGMGGHFGGEFASKIAIYVIEENLKNILPAKSNYNIPSILEEAIHEAGSIICRRSQENPNLQGMGTTVTLLAIANNLAYFAHVGDSRAYLFRESVLQQLTEDHSLVYEQFKYGLITKEELATYQYKNVITRSVGVHEEIVIDTFHMDIKKDDIFLICSDGLSNMVSDDNLTKLLSNYESYLTLYKLIDLANSNGGDDNMTMILAKIA